MIKRVSFYDVLSIPAFHGMSHFDLLPRKMDSEVLPYLFKMGINIDTQVLVQPCRHRTLEGKEALGYTYVGMERTDKQWLDSKFSTMSARIASQKDKELASDMLKSSREGVDYSSFVKMALMAATSDELKQAKERRESIVPLDTYDDDLSIMKSLKLVQESARGYLHPDEDMINPPQGVL